MIGAATAPGEVAAIVAGTHRDPFAVLGMHETDQGLVVRAFIPGARRMWVVEARSGDALAELLCEDAAGFFAARLPGRRRFPYRLRVQTDGGTGELEDPYRFGPVLGEFDVHLLAEGTHLRPYESLGAHCITLEGVRGTAFAVWAPNAKRVSVVGDFNAWDGRRHPMRFRVECGVWEIFLPGIGEGATYKYEILGADGTLLPLKADPYAFRAEPPPATASIVAVIERSSRAGVGWFERRAEAGRRDAPITIYEVHLGSWKRKPEEHRRYLGYDELADDLIPYARWMGYTHIELLPIAEYPFDGSWGYQPIALFAPTSRFGDPSGFRAFVDRAHAEGIGIICDWVPAHFITDAHGLGYFDGTHLYEHADPRQGFHPDWNTFIYNYGRREVANFLRSSALFWLDVYNVDGLRVDAVASMLYLDYSRKEGEWIPNVYGGNENLAAIAFLRRLNEVVYAEEPTAFTVAEESTAWPMVSAPTHAGGLGFGYKWNMGWMHDTLEFMRHDPIHRKYHLSKLSFGLLYAFSENYILPLSHDEVVHGKGSLLGKMPGDRRQRFANLRLLYALMYAHPGKKLLFMGGEFGQEREWDHDRSLDWHLLGDPSHAGIQTLVRDLNRVYRSTPALYELDAEPAGFEWIDFSDCENTVVSFIRRSRDGTPVVAAFNFTPVVREGYRLGVPCAGLYRELINTDSALYGGSNIGNGGSVLAQETPSHGRTYSLTLTLPPLGALYLTPAA
jgi:1,4-alpha-glucan branching enzyme